MLIYGLEKGGRESAQGAEKRCAHTHARLRDGGFCGFLWLRERDYTGVEALDCISFLGGDDDFFGNSLGLVADAMLCYIRLV